MQMKFMQKTQETSVEEEENDTNQFNSTFDHMHKQVKFVFEPSYAVVEQLKYGRQSFRGMNPEIERLNEELNPTGSSIKQEASSSHVDMEMDIDDKEMARVFAENRKGFKRRR